MISQIDSPDQSSSFSLSKPWSLLRCWTTFLLYLCLFSALVCWGLIGIKVAPVYQVENPSRGSGLFRGQVISASAARHFMSPPEGLAREVAGRVNLRVLLKKTPGGYRPAQPLILPPQAKIYLICKPRPLWKHLRRGLGL